MRIPRRPGMPSDRVIAVAFVVLVSSAIVGLSAGDTGATFTATTTNPSNSLNTLIVLPPASQSAPTSSAAGIVNLSWTATPTSPGTHTLTYLVFRNGTQVGSTSSLTFADTPPADGTYAYTIQTKIAQGAGFFTSVDSASQNGKSDRTAPTMSATCNGGSCAGWFNGAVTFVVSGNDGAGVGMGTATTNVDGAGAVTSAAPRTVTVSGQSATHSVVYSGADAAGNASGNTSQTVQIDLTAPTGAGSFAANPGQQNGEVDLTWTAGSDALSGLAGYVIRRAQATTCPAATTTNYPVNVTVGAVTAYTWSGLTAGASYCFYIQTNDNAGNLSTASAPAGPILAQ